MLQPGGEVYFKKAGGTHHSTVCCFTFRPPEKTLYFLACHHSVEGSVDGRAYDDAECRQPVGTVADRGQGDGAEDFALVRVDEPGLLSEKNFRVATTSISLTRVGLQLGGRPVFFPGSMSRAHIGAAEPRTVLRPQSAIASRAARLSQRFEISGGVNSRFSCRKGDSGSPVYQDGGLLTGMYHMGDGGPTGAPGSSGRVIDIEYVFRRLNVSLATWDNRDQWLDSGIGQETDAEGVVWNTAF
jgi:hypothetical protein